MTWSTVSPQPSSARPSTSRPNDFAVVPTRALPFSLLTTFSDLLSFSLSLLLHNSINSDVWSMAVTVLEVAFNRYPFPGKGEAPLTSPIEILMYLDNMTTVEIEDEPDVGIKYTNGFRRFIELW